MKMFRVCLAVFAYMGFAAVPAARATVYPGNGDASFGGAIGQGSLDLTNTASTFNGTLTKGPGGFNDVLVIYLDTVAGGIGSDTSALNDGGDGLRKSISGFDGGTNRSVLTFPAGFNPDYAMALGPNSDNFGGIWQLTANSGNNGLPFISSANLSPTGTSSNPTYTFSFDASQLGVVGNGSFQMLGTYTSNSGFRSAEAILGNVSGTSGWSPFTASSPVTVTVPEPASLGLLALAVPALLRRRRSR